MAATTCVSLSCTTVSRGRCSPRRPPSSPSSRCVSAFVLIKSDIVFWVTSWKYPTIICKVLALTWCWSLLFLVLFHLLYLQVKLSSAHFKSKFMQTSSWLMTCNKSSVMSYVWVSPYTTSISRTSTRVRSRQQWFYPDTGRVPAVDTQCRRPSTRCWSATAIIATSRSDFRPSSMTLTVRVPSLKVWTSKCWVSSIWRWSRRSESSSSSAASSSQTRTVRCAAY